MATVPRQDAAGDVAVLRGVERSGDGSTCPSGEWNRAGVRDGDDSLRRRGSYPHRAKIQLDGGVPLFRGQGYGLDAVPGAEQDGETDQPDEDEACKFFHLSFVLRIYRFYFRPGIKNYKHHINTHL